MDLPTTALKRCREDGEFEGAEVAKCLMLLSRVGQFATKTESGRVFACKTCNKEFPSFQALGGHRASHKKPKLLDSDLFSQSTGFPAKAKTHECPICGLDFPMGQALGGHMRRHRGAAMAESVESKSPSPSLPPAPQQVPVLKKSSSKRVLCLDLNLTPLENDLSLQLGKMTPVV